MIYAIVVAGGIGSRMGKDKPKQFLNIGEKPIIIHTIENFVNCADIDKVVVAVPEEWTSYTNNLINDAWGELPTKEIGVVIGGSSRNETIMNAIDYIESKGDLDAETIIVTHDAVRPFINDRVIKDNVNAVRRCCASATVIEATDTIIESEDGNTIDRVPDRSKLYQAQTPQCFRAVELRDAYSLLNEEDKKLLTDATKIYVLQGKAVELVQGERYNIKITYPHDIDYAEAIIKSIGR